MKKTALLFIFIVTSVFALEFNLSMINIEADGTTNYDGIHCTVERGNMSDGMALKLVISKDVIPKRVDLFMATSRGERIANCGIEASDKGNASMYRLDLGKEYLKESVLWVSTGKYGLLMLNLKQCKKNKG